MSLRVLVTVENLYPLGDARLLLPLIENWSDRGIDIVIAVLGQRAYEPERWIQAGARLFFVNGDDTTPLHSVRDGWTVVRELRSLFRLIEPDVVHAWGEESTWLTLLAASEIPRLFRQSQLPELRLTATSLSVPRAQHFLRRYLEGYLSSRLESWVIPHQQIVDRAKQRLLEPQRTVTIGNATVVDSFLPESGLALTDRGSEARKQLRDAVRQELNLPTEANLAIAVADLEAGTRLKDLVWATDLLACIRDDFHFLIIGKGSQLKRLQRFAALTEARPNVHFLGQPVHPDRYLAASDVYWHSHLQTPLPVNLLSAMGMGVPVVSVWGPGIEEIVRHQETGFAVNFGARDEFARWTKYIIEQTESAERLAWQGKHWVTREFPIEPIADAYRELWSNLTGLGTKPASQIQP